MLAIPYTSLLSLTRDPSHLKMDLVVYLLLTSCSQGFLFFQYFSIQPPDSPYTLLIFVNITIYIYRDKMSKCKFACHFSP